MAAPGTYPVPPGRGRWRFTLHTRSFADGVYPTTTGIGELTDAHSRKLVQALNSPAVLSFSLDGHSPNAALIQEMAHDVIAWRWDDQQNRDVMSFRGIVAQSQDTLSEQTATVAFTCHDYLAMLGRRFLTAPVTYTQQDQDVIARSLVLSAIAIHSSSGTSFAPGSYLPLDVTNVAPDGSMGRNVSGQKRDRTYPGQTVLGEALDQLAHVINGFDYDCWYVSDIYGRDQVRLWYPSQGVLRTSPQLMYGSTLSSLTRTVDSTNYANYERVLGNNGSSDPAAAQLFAETWNADSNNVTVSPQGLWMGAESAADVTLVQTLADRAAGDLARNGLLVPNYSAVMRPGAYSAGNPNMGDVVPLIIQAGRLNVNTTIRIVGIAFDIGDDGQEDVSLTLGRPDTTFADIFLAADQDVNALVRR